VRGVDELKLGGRGSRLPVVYLFGELSARVFCLLVREKFLPWVNTFAN